jgi:hypothetical protein
MTLRPHLARQARAAAGRARCPRPMRNLRAGASARRATGTAHQRPLPRRQPAHPGQPGRRRTARAGAPDLRRPALQQRRGLDATAAPARPAALRRERRRPAPGAVHRHVGRGRVSPVHLRPAARSCATCWPTTAHSGSTATTATRITCAACSTRSLARENYLNTITWRSQTPRGAKANAFYFPNSGHTPGLRPQPRRAAALARAQEAHHPDRSPGGRQLYARRTWLLPHLRPRRLQLCQFAAPPRTRAVSTRPLAARS